MRRAELGRQPLQTVCPPRPEYQVRPFGGEPPGARLADARTCAGDQDELSRDVTHVGDQNDSLPRSTTVLPSIATVASLIGTPNPKWRRAMVPAPSSSLSRS